MNQKNSVIVSDFNGLLRAFSPLIMGEKSEIENLYDIWKMGAPTPDSIILDVKNYRPEEHNQSYGRVKKVIPTLWLEKWLTDLATRRGIPLSSMEVKNILEG